MNSFRADLHCHSTYSDGSMTPEEIVRLAASLDLQGLSITDHDNINSYAAALPFAKELNIELISGVEFSSIHKGSSVHILGYGYRHTHKEIIDFCKHHRLRRIERCKKILSLLKDMKMPIAEDELLQLCSNGHTSVGTIGRPHIALAMIKKNYVPDVQTAFKKYLGDGCPCYVPNEGFTPEETIEILHRAGGVAIIAHPHLIKNSTLFLDLLKMPFDGMECFYGKFPLKEQQRWLKIAEYRNWLITGGSDFHGTVKPNLQLGASWTTEEHFNKLKLHL